MSGGHFNYYQYHISEISENIKSIIERGNYYGDDEEGIERENLPEDILAEFKTATEILDKAHVYAHRIDWLLSGDDGEDSFRKRLKSDLEKLQENK